MRRGYRDALRFLARGIKCPHELHTRDRLVTVRIGGKTPHKLHAHVQDPLSTAELHTSPEGTLKRDMNIVPREANKPLARPCKYMGV